MHIVECTRGAWVAFHDAAPDASVYETPPFLEAYGLPVRYWQCMKGSAVLAGLAVVEAGNSVRRLVCQQYNGLVFRAAADEKRTTQVGLNHAASEAFAQHVMATYDTVDLAHNTSVVDMRPFQWVNYHEPEAPRFALNVEYTTLVNVTCPDDHSGLQTLRRRNLAKANQAGTETSETDDVGHLLDLVSSSYSRQSLSLDTDNLTTFRKIAAALLRHGIGKLYITSLQGRPLAAALFGIHGKRAYYILGGGAYDARADNAGTKVIIDAFTALHRDHDIEYVDLVGVNSPNRGAFKLSFGGNLIPYYRTLKR